MSVVSEFDRSSRTSFGRWWGSEVQGRLQAQEAADCDEEDDSYGEGTGAEGKGEAAGGEGRSTLLEGELSSQGDGRHRHWPYSKHCYKSKWWPPCRGPFQFSVWGFYACWPCWVQWNEGCVFWHFPSDFSASATDQSNHHVSSSSDQESDSSGSRSDSGKARTTCFHAILPVELKANQTSRVISNLWSTRITVFSWSCVYAHEYCPAEGSVWPEPGPEGHWVYGAATCKTVRWQWNYRPRAWTWGQCRFGWCQPGQEALLLFCREDRIRNAGLTRHCGGGAQPVADDGA